MNQKEKKFQYITYGSKCNAQEVEQFLSHLLHLTFEATERPNGLLPTPICIWGTHGIGKTELVHTLAKKLNCRFAYFAPAQFEEMGDLIGMPKIMEDEKGRSVSRFMPPDWVPKEEGPGILLIDDVNRSDDRILRGIMQLLQNHELVSWKLPPKWHIILTANPDGGDYSVTPLDDAMLTRMLHITMEFDVKNWALWAEGTGIDPRGINFVLSYPELVNNERTTPRTLVQFFQQIQKLEDLNENISLVKMLADACLEPETSAAFISFIRMKLFQLISPKEIIESKKFEFIENRLRNLIDGPTKRMDILSVICTRLLNYLLSNKPSMNPSQTENLKNFLLLDFIPNDVRLSLAQELTMSGHPPFQKLLGIPEVGKLLLQKM